MAAEQSNDVEAFIKHWSAPPVSERSQCQTFIIQLCRLIGVPAPDDVRAGDLDYCFERPVQFRHDDGSTTAGRIDCAKLGCFVPEAKQSDKRRDGGPMDTAAQLALLGRSSKRGFAPSPHAVDRVMRVAKRQAENYAKALDEWPPFLITVDVGRSIELWSDFARQGKIYAPFPDRAGYRITLDQLRSPEVRERLRRVWTNPMSLDPAARSAAVTTEIATSLAWLVKSINGRRQAGLRPVDRAAQASKTARFVMQCIFAMFADSVGLIERRSFLGSLESHRGEAERFHQGARSLLTAMDQGGYCVATRQPIHRFNGGLYSTVETLPIEEGELAALIAAAKCDWTDVEPAIFGTLLEQALDPAERAELGAHYTPRAYVERLIEPTIMEPLRADWEAVEGEAVADFMQGDVVNARRRLHAFHDQLCKTRVLDPACGTGNFLYVAMRMMKELEEEIFSVLGEMGEHQGVLAFDGRVVSPEQFYVIEKNANAAWIAEMVMWIGHLQWHFRISGAPMPSEPILKNFRTIRQADALLEFSRVEVVHQRDQAERETVRYVDPRPTPWPEVDFIVGNPPFIGGKGLRRELGDGYVDALAAIRDGRFLSADLVMAWWDRAAEILIGPDTRLRRFGFITTNSITQTFSRRVIAHHLAKRPPIRIVFAIADHPWARGAGCADVRIAMSVAERGEPDGQGRWLRVKDADTKTFEERHGDIGPDLLLDSRLTRTRQQKANAVLAYRGMQLMGAGFQVTPEKANHLLAGSEPQAPSPVRDYRNGRDLADRSRGLQVIDFFGWDEGEARRRHPLLFQHLLETVKSDRDRNNRAAYRDNWWIFGEPRRDLRDALEGLSRFIVTIETAKHRWFRFMDAATLPDNKLVVIASDDPFVLGVLSSRQHRAWFAANAGRIGEREVYVKGACFDTFAFPDAGAALAAEIGVLAEELDAVRAGVLRDSDALTMTGLYNARARKGLGDRVSDAERAIHDQGRVGIIDHLHQRLDQLVAKAYGWPDDLADSQIVERLIQMNQARAEQEEQGDIRFLRPAYQAGKVRQGVARPPQPLLPTSKEKALLPEQPGVLASSLLSILRRQGVPMSPTELTDEFEGSRPRAKRRIIHTLKVLAVAGSVQMTDTGWFAPRRMPS
ncbi:class I SAM-dependent DNA methyltransferase [Brevundimonas intermedia]|uniref:class I SAM-dependent DNA methyltransferase n=1 Tax=Brevundimonas intermedia TaxID=74315 RepID=UPI0032083BD1